MADNRTWWEKALDALPEYDSTRDFTIKGHKVTTPPNPVDTVLGFGHSLARNLPRSLDEDFLRVSGDVLSGKRDPLDPSTFVPFALNFVGAGGVASAVKGVPKGAIGSNLLEAPARAAPKAAKAAKQPKTVVAMRHPETDELIIGKPGENHADLMEKAGWPQGVDDRQHMGWYNKDTGVYESRSGAAQRLKAEEPDVYEKTPGIQSGRLEANKLTAGRFLAGGSSKKLAGDLQDSGGFSVSLRDGSMPESGYMVGKFPNKDNMVIDGYATPEDIEKFAKRYAQSLGQKDHYLGGWFDPETGKTYLDVSVRYADKDEAIKAGLKTEQLTGYDVKSGDVFNIAKDRTRLKPALAHPTNPERVKIGKPGDTHLGLEADNPDFYAGSAGYVDEMGNFMDRDAAGDFARANPDVFKSPEYRQTFEDNDFLDTTMLWANNKNAAPLALAPNADIFPFDRQDTLRTIGKPTVDVKDDVYMPGIYDDPRTIVEGAMEKWKPSKGNMERLFGVTREDLAAINDYGRRSGNISPVIKGSKSPQGMAISNPQNLSRLQDTLYEAGKTPLADMDAWYVMDPLFHEFVKEYGPQQAVKEYTQFNANLALHSPGTSVPKEITRGTLANKLFKQGRGEEWLDYGGMPNSQNSTLHDDIYKLPDAGHAYHSTSVGDPLKQYWDTGQLRFGDDTVKVPLYEMASGVPETGFQTILPVPDGHFTRAVGLPDVRGATKTRAQSMKRSPYAPFGPAFREGVTDPLGIQAVPGQARLWGTMSRITGVDSPIGAGKLEMFADNIARRAGELRMKPEDVLRRVIRGEEAAMNPATAAPMSLLPSSFRED